MGVNIFILDAAGANVPESEWDWYRQADDTRFVREIVPGLPCDFHGDVADHARRPIDFPTWRSAIRAANLEEGERYERLLDILEADPARLLDFAD